MLEQRLSLTDSRSLLRGRRRQRPSCVHQHRCRKSLCRPRRHRDALPPAIKVPVCPQAREMAQRTPRSVRIHSMCRQSNGRQVRSCRQTQRRASAGRHRADHPRTVAESRCLVAALSGHSSTSKSRPSGDTLMGRLSEVSACSTSSTPARFEFFWYKSRPPFRRELKITRRPSRGPDRLPLVRCVEREARSHPRPQVHEPDVPRILLCWPHQHSLAPSYHRERAEVRIISPNGSLHPSACHPERNHVSLDAPPVAA